MTGRRGACFRAIRYGMTVTVLMLSEPGGAQMQDSLIKSMEYVRSLDANCTLDHGYRCVQPEEDDFLGADTDQKLIFGPYLQAWMASYEDFKQITEMTDEQKELKHYKVGFTESDTDYIVLIMGLLLPEIVEGQPVGLTRSTFGLSTKYWIDKKTLKISKRLFLK